MDSIVLSVVVSRHFEKRLRSLGAQGQGIHSLTTSIEHYLTPEVIRLLRRIASVRNSEKHEEDGSFDEKRFLKDALELSRLLPEIINKPEANSVVVTESLPCPPVADEILESVPVKVPLSDDAVFALIQANKISRNDLEEEIGRANTIALSVYYPCYEDWDAFLYLAKNKSTNDQDRLRNLGLASAAGCDSSILIKVARNVCDLYAVSCTQT